MKISVLTCVLNQSPAWFETAARSVSSLGSEVEWIVVDDGSDEEHTSRQERIALSCGPRGHTRYLHFDSNRGLSIARNAALTLATGEWVVVLDSDDELMEVLPAVLKSAPSRTALVSCAADYFTAHPW